MSFSGFSLCLLLSFASTASCNRAQVSQHVKDKMSEVKHTGKPHQCSIRWPFRNQVASVSFGVQSCRIGCIGTNFDANHDAMFQLAFTEKCKDKEGGTKKCWDTYKTLATDTLDESVGHEGRKGLEISHHFELYNANKFDYTCKEDGCKAGEDCFSSELPSGNAGRSDREQKLLGSLFQQLNDGEITEQGLSNDVKALMEGFSEEEKALYMGFATLNPDGSEENVIDGHATRTVGMLKEAYAKKLASTGISVDHLMKVAGMDPVNGLEQELTEEAFQRFLRPTCPEDYSGD